MTPALALALWLVLAVACALHAVQGGPARRWLRGLLAAPAGFVVGEALARLAGSDVGALGGVHVLHATAAAGLAAWVARRWWAWGGA